MRVCVCVCKKEALHILQHEMTMALNLERDLPKILPMVPGCAGVDASKQSKGYKKTRAYGDVCETEVVGRADG